MKRFQLLQVTSPLVEFECGGKTVRSEPIKDANNNPNFTNPVLSFEVVSFAQLYSMVDRMVGDTL